MESSANEESKNNASPLGLSIVIPAYNEQRRLPQSLRDIHSFIRPLVPSYEIIVVVERSTDQTLDCAKAAQAKYSNIAVIENEEQRGKGYAVKTGMLKARGEFAFFMDADLSTPLSEIVLFLTEFQKNPDTDVLIGDRSHPQSQILKRQKWLRQTMGKTFNLFVRALGLSFTDTQCGFKAFRKKAYQDIFPRIVTEGFAFDVEVLFMAQKLGYQVKTKPVRWINSPDSKVRMVRDSLSMLWDLFKLTLRQRKTKPE